MIRRAWFTTPADISDETVRVSEIGAAPFALVVAFEQTKHGTYLVRMRIKVRNEEILERITAHNLWKTDVYVDRDALSAAEERKELAKERRAVQDEWEAGYGFGFLHYYLIREGWAWFKEKQTVRVSFRTLYDGIAVKGDMNSCARVSREISMQIDRLAAQLDTANAFEVGQVRVFAPGNRVKPGKPAGISPSKWRR